jgi:PhoPQ-activated pathogenicity-related protein
MSGMKKIFLIVLAICIASAAVSTESFVYTHIVHQCSHTSQCPVCHEIQIARNFLSSLGLLAFAALTLLTVYKAGEAVKKLHRIYSLSFNLVLLKVKSNT